MDLSAQVSFPGVWELQMGSKGYKDGRNRKEETFLGREEQKWKNRSGNASWWNSEATGLTGLKDESIMNDTTGLCHFKAYSYPFQESSKQFFQLREKVW